MAKQKAVLRSWSDELRWAISFSGLTGYQLSKVTGVAEAVIGRFRRKERGIKFETAEKLGRAVGVTLRAEKE
jgi:hypothetical protein